MFDPITTQLIRSSPPLDGLNLDDLPKRLTAAFADIVSARIVLRGAQAASSPELGETLSSLRRLAAAHEAYVVLLPDRENRAAAAFVAACAHQACIVGSPASGAMSRIDVAAVTADICATLLFLIAEAHADAAEAAKRIAVHSELASPVERALLLSIKNLAQGNLISILRAGVPAVAGTEAPNEDRALQALQLMLLRGVRNLAGQLRRRFDVAPSEGGIETSADIFRRVKNLCAESIPGLGSEDRAYSLFPGPMHLANLLLSVERDLLDSALTRTPTPGGLAEAEWWQIIRRMARKRPYLWRNHRDAIKSGYLDEGISSAISFPTGGGKSTLAELKIATALLRGEKVVFLAPTHALVGQTTRGLKATFQNFDVVGDVDDDLTVIEEVILPEVTVTTPERCLMLMSVQAEAFAGLGLIVFDECHLLHPRDTDRSRRGLDAMLAILNLTELAPKADLLLLSAMMKNTEEVAGWIESIIGRKCLKLDLAWKPTRQVRGCVVYPADQVVALNARLAEARVRNPAQKSTPADVKRELLATPFGLFGLLQTWSTTNREDYTLLPLLKTAQLLSTGKRKRGGWYLTPNGNETSSAIAAASVAAGMKTLVFVQTTVFCEKCVREFPDRLSSRPVTLSDEERAWYSLAVEEMGGPEFCYLQLANDGILRSGAASHHSLLLREERELHESLFKRRDGIDVLFATSTLAQGMNLPSEVVIISGDSRFDPSADKMTKLEAHELLNAAGRAGRAGEGAQGFVLLVPSKVIEFDDQKNQINGHWMELQSIFEQADQCLNIEDPLTGLLDQVHHGLIQSGTAAYFLSRLPHPTASAEADPAERLLRRSFAAYHAREDNQWTESRIQAALAARPEVTLPADKRWLENVAGSTGLSVYLLEQLIQHVDAGALGGSAANAISSLFAWIEANPIILLDFVRPENLEGLFGEDYKKMATDLDRSSHALKVVRQALPIWMSGAPLSKLEVVFVKRSDKLGRCEYARHFVSRVVPDIAFLSGLAARLIVARGKQVGVETTLSTVIATLGSVVREGCDSPEALATRLNCGRGVSRVSARTRFDEIKAFAAPGGATEDFESTRNRMRMAEVVARFRSIWA